MRLTEMIERLESIAACAGDLEVTGQFAIDKDNIATLMVIERQGNASPTTARA